MSTKKWAIIAVVLTIATMTRAADPPAPEPPPAEQTTAEPRPLSDTREHEKDYGLSLQPPVGTRVIRQTASRYLMQIADEDGKFKMFVSVKRLRRAVEIPQIAADAEAEMERIHETYQVLDERLLTVAERPAVLLYFDVPKAVDEGRMLLGQAYVQIAIDTVALIETEAAAEDGPMVRATFEAVLESLEVKGVAELAVEREAAAERSRQFHRGLRPAAVHAALIPEQVFRIVETGGGKDSRKGKDIGWMRVRQYQAERVEEPGVEVELRARIFTGPQASDTLALYFVADDDSYEEWSVTTTRRAATGKPDKKANTETNDDTAREIGVRTAGKIDVRIDAPRGGSETLSFPRPDATYLSQAAVWLLPQLLPTDQPATYGFYCYSPAHRKIQFRTDQVVPVPDGFMLITRPAPSDPALKAAYDNNRRLREKHLSPTTRLVPTTPEALKAIWRE